MGRWVQLVVLTVVVLSGVAGAAGAAGTDAPRTAATNQAGERPGPQVAAFTGATSAATGAAVDQGMWEAALKQADPSERAQMVRERARSLERRMDALELDRTAMNDSAGPAAAGRRGALDSRASALATASADTAAVAESQGQSETAATLRGLERRAERMDREMSPGPAADTGSDTDPESSNDTRPGGEPNEEDPGEDDTATTTDGSTEDALGEQAGETDEGSRNAGERG